MINKNKPNNYLHLVNRIREIHINCFRLCKNTFSRYLPIAGNIGIFCQSEQDFNQLTEIRRQIAQSSDNPHQKYYRLKEPIVIPRINDIPETNYTHLYIRKPSANSPQEGDIDFVLSSEKYKKLKQKLLDGIKIKGAGIYNRPGWDMVELKNPKVAAIAYVGTKEMSEKVRVKFD